jgi:hypothetical protein
VTFSNLVLLIGAIAIMVDAWANIKIIRMLDKENNQNNPRERTWHL